jgi:hypothetical protein
MVPISTVESPAIIEQQDEEARKFASMIGTTPVYEDYVDQCGYLMDSAGCYVAFPDCPGHEECLLVCEQMINCVQAAADANGNSSATPTVISCDNYCSEFAAGSIVSYSLMLMALVAVIAVIF